MRGLGGAVLASALLLSGCIGAGSNTGVEPLAADRFPKVTGISLLGDEVTLPKGFEGELNLVSMGFVQAHQDDINVWIEALPRLEADLPGLRFYEVPVIYEAGPLFRWWLNNGMRIGVVEEEARRRTITIYTDRDSFTDALKLPDIERIHTVLLNAEGDVLWRAAGPPDDASLSEFLQIAAESG